MRALSTSVMAAIFCKESVVRGHHVYKAVWTPFVGEILDARREDENSHDRHAVAVFDSCVVGLTYLKSIRE